MIERVMRLWSKNSLEIVTSAGASAALALVQDQQFDLVVVDVCMPVVDGLQFLSILNRRHPGLQKVVLTGYATEAYRIACLSNGAELFLEKPRTSEGLESIFATLNELTRWKPEPGFRGVLRRVGLMDLIQMECLGRSSSLLSVTAPKTTGAIYIKEGFIVHAEAGELKGEPAFKHLLGLTSGDFRLNPYVDPPEETITGPWEGLLMDAAQSRDEAAERNAPSAAGGTEANLELPALDPTLLESGTEESPLRIDELMICSEEGDVYHSWQCGNTELRINLLEFLSQKARLLQNVLPLGTFDRAEFESGGTRLIAKIGLAGGSVVLRTSSSELSETRSDESTKLPAPVPPPSPELKAEAQEWFQQHLDLAGLLAATLQFPDRSGSSHSVSTKFAPDALGSLRRCVSDGFQVLRLQRFEAMRARWLYDQTAVECVQRPDGTAIALVMARQTLELNRKLIEHKLADFSRTPASR
jgi:CheY-like chemotaxis protein